jgi:hypothetical protein
MYSMENSQYSFVLSHIFTSLIPSSTIMIPSGVPFLSPIHFL